MRAKIRWVRLNYVRSPDTSIISSHTQAVKSNNIDNNCKRKKLAKLFHL